jgi:hypothetical protein
MTTLLCQPFPQLACKVHAYSPASLEVAGENPFTAGTLSFSVLSWLISVNDFDKQYFLASALLLILFEIATLPELVRFRR